MATKKTPAPRTSKPAASPRSRSSKGATGTASTQIPELSPVQDEAGETGASSVLAAEPSASDVEPSAPVPEPSVTAAGPTHREIAEAAYLRFLRRGGSAGSDFNDWLEAEQELKSKRPRA